MLFLKYIFRTRERLQLRNTDNAGAEMPFLDHLEELRRTIIAMLLTTVCAMLLCFCFAQELMLLLRYPAEQIYERQEQAHLPQHIKAAHWQLAKDYAALAPTLTAEDAARLQHMLPPEVPPLAAAAPLLQAARLLPQDAQETFLAQSTAPAEVRETALALHHSGAISTVGSAHASLKLMGAFQPAEAFMLSLQLAFFAGLVLSFPILMLLLMRFIVPGLHAHEKRMLYKSVVWGFFLFIAGCVFAYCGVLPRVLAFFYTYAQGMGIENDWRIGYYLSFTIKLIFMFGVVFELPVIVIPLIKLGILHYTKMKKTRGYALIACFAAALVLAPAPDPATMLIMALPMYALYELCIAFAWVQYKKRLANLPHHV